jgi:hypothetical protein
MSRGRAVAAAVTIVAGALLLTVGALYYLAHRGVVNDAHAPIPPCPDRALPPDVETLVRRVLVARQSDDWAPDYAELEALLNSREPAALEARVALMAYYIGEHPAEELFESVLADRAVATPIVKRYSECRPRLSSERGIGTVVSLRTLYDHYVKEVRDDTG